MAFFKRIGKFLLGETLRHLIFEKAKCWVGVLVGGGPIGQVLFAGFTAFSLLHALYLVH